MNIFSLLFFLANAVLLLFLPRRWVSISLLISTCLMTRQGIEIGQFNFNFVRMIIFVGIVRVIFRGERLNSGMNKLDWLIVLWAIWAVVSSYFHNYFSEALEFRFGLIYNVCGIYFLVRIWCQSLDDLVLLSRSLAIILVPLAVEMFFEKTTYHNLFSVFGGVSESPLIREGKIRAQGPFAHSILAGTVGAVILPLMICLWHRYNKQMFIGVVSCLVIVFTSASSGPIMSAFAAFVALVMWRFNEKMRAIRWLIVIGYIILDFVMKAPAYYIINRIDLTGSSGGYHRARLIESALKHINEWWFAGTDYTRHWMVTGVSYSTDQSDITNYYLKMGVIGGLPLMLLFIAILAVGFSYVGQILKQNEVNVSAESKFRVWCIGAALFAHVATCISVSYFDQSYVFLYLTLAVISSIWSNTMIKPNTAQNRPFHR